jgi:hypothetical protein
MLGITYYSAKSIVKTFKRERRIDKLNTKTRKNGQNPMPQMCKDEEKKLEADPSTLYASPATKLDLGSFAQFIPRLLTLPQKMADASQNEMWGILLADHSK